MLQHAILYYSVVYYIVLYYIILYYTKCKHFCHPIRPQVHGSPPSQGLRVPRLLVIVFIIITIITIAIIDMFIISNSSSTSSSSSSSSSICSCVCIIIIIIITNIIIIIIIISSSSSTWCHIPVYYTVLRHGWQACALLVFRACVSTASCMACCCVVPATCLQVWMLSARSHALFPSCMYMLL